MRAKLLFREVLPSLVIFTTLVGSALVADALLHAVNAVWLGRYLGIPGTLLILASLVYSLRKRKVIERGNPVQLLRFHELVAWMGSMLILVHAGIHFNAFLAWFALLAMLINVASGLTGKFLLRRAARRLNDARQKLQLAGLSRDQIEQKLHWDTLTFDAVKQWRRIHFPIAFAFGALAIAHISAIFLFWSWW